MVLSDIGAESLELLGPASLGAFEPSAQIAERFLAELVDADSSIEGGRGVGDQTPLAQSPQVFAHRGRSHSERTREFPGAVGAQREKFDGSAT
jgi:hypothetical protein